MSLISKRYANQEPEAENLKRCANTAARNPKQDFRNVATVVPAIKHARKYVEKGNKTLPPYLPKTKVKGC